MKAHELVKLTGSTELEFAFLENLSLLYAQIEFAICLCKLR